MVCYLCGIRIVPHMISIDQNGTIDWHTFHSLLIPCQSAQSSSPLTLSSLKCAPELKQNPTTLSRWPNFQGPLNTKGTAGPGALYTDRRRDRWWFACWPIKIDVHPFHSTNRQCGRTKTRNSYLVEETGQEAAVELAWDGMEFRAHRPTTPSSATHFH